MTRLRKSGHFARNALRSPVLIEMVSVENSSEVEVYQTTSELRGGGAATPGRVVKLSIVRIEQRDEYGFDHRCHCEKRSAEAIQGIAKRPTILWVVSLRSQ